MSTSAPIADDRIVTDVVGGSGFYFSRFATGGPYVFMAGAAVDSAGRIQHAQLKVLPEPREH